MQPESQQEGGASNDIDSYVMITTDEPCTISGNKYYIHIAGNTFRTHHVRNVLQHMPDLDEVKSVDKCDFILVICPVVSRAGTDIEAALNSLNELSESKPSAFMVLHHTFDPEKIVPESSRCVNRKNTLTLDILFHEDEGLLNCMKNEEALNRMQQWMLPQTESWALGGCLVLLRPLAAGDGFYGRGQPVASPPFPDPPLYGGRHMLLPMVYSGNSSAPSRTAATPPRPRSTAARSQSHTNTPELTPAPPPRPRCPNSSALRSPSAMRALRQHVPPSQTDLSVASELMIVLLGISESGKAAVGNMVRKEMGKADISTANQNITVERGTIAGEKVSLMDTPDWFNSVLSLEEIKENIQFCISMCSSKPFAVLLVIPVKHLTEEEEKIMENMNKILDNSCWERVMIIFVTDDQNNQNIELFKQHQNVKNLMDNCGNRVHFGQTGNSAQVSDMLKKIEEMVAGKEESGDVFKLAESDLKTAIAKYEQGYIEKVKNYIKIKPKELQQSIWISIRSAVYQLTEQIDEEHDCVKVDVVK